VGSCASLSSRVTKQLWASLARHGASVLLPCCQVCLLQLTVVHCGLVQDCVEDGLVGVDIALPDFKVAFFLAAPPGASPASGGGSPAPRLSSLDPEGAMLSG
jgi:hypothetical protein